jgi:CRP-like cAMP-binding protein
MKSAPLLKYISDYIALTPEEEQLLDSRVITRKYLKGQYVVQQGDVCRFESFVLSGCLKLFYIDPEGEEHIAMFAIENWWTSDFGSFLTQTPADYNVQCLENTEVLQISYDNLQLLYEEIPKLERFFRIIVQKAYVASQKRVIRSFSLTAKEKYLRFREEYPQIEQRVPQYMVASYLGITKEFLSKIRNQLIIGE